MTRGEFYTLEEASSVVGCDAQRLANLVREGRVSALRDGSRMLFRRSEIDGLRQANANSPILQCPNCPKRYRLPLHPPAAFACRGCGTILDLSSFNAAAGDGPSESVDCDEHDGRTTVDRSTWIAFGCIGVVLIAFTLAVVVPRGSSKETSLATRTPTPAVHLTTVEPPLPPPTPVRLAAGASLDKRTLRVTNTWVFCDEPKYGAFVLGHIPGLEANGIFWVKLPSRYRWITSTRIASAKVVEVSGVVRGPRGDGTQVEDGVVHAIDGQNFAQEDVEFGWQSLVDVLFDDSATSGIKIQRWRKIRDLEFADVGRLEDLTKNFKNRVQGGLGLALVKFRESPFVSSTAVGLASSFWESEAEKFPKGAFVAIRGRISSTALLSDVPGSIGDIQIVDSTLEIVSDKTGSGWGRLR